MAPSTKKQSLAVLGVLGAAGLIWALSKAAKPETAPPLPPAVTGPTLHGFAGSASCSARACHGNDRPVDDKAVALQNEYTTSLMHDKHVQAYSVLLGERGKTIARNLSARTGQPPVEAYHDWRCLACHATPQSAWDQYQKKQSDSATINWQIGGVGCEACHGGSMGAKPWLAAHTAKTAWRDLLKPRDKQEYGFADLSDATSQAQVCAGCHVGAPPDEKRKIPPRDCNHDIMAAGHPRLNFELTVYRENMPPHWNVSLKKDDPGKTWLDGRIGAAKASLELLQYRADQATNDSDSARWPEFAEYRCYSCHRDLNNDWRGAKNEPGRARGSFPYDSWYGSLLPALDPKLADGYGKLTTEMAKPLPSPEAVKATAATLLEILKKSPDGTDLLTKITTANKSLPNDWEDAMQLTLALAALKKKDLQAGDSSDNPLRKMAKALSFPLEKGWRGEGPKGIDYPKSLQDAQKAYEEFLKTVK